MNNSAFLRKADKNDCDLIFEWANDEDERRNSFNPEKIKYEEHCSWYKRKMESDDTIIYIFYMNDTPIGQVRIEIENKEGLISYFIAKEFRGNGYGKMMLNLLKEKIKADHLEVNKLIAQVKTDNIASQKVFKALGFSESCYFEQEL